MAIPFLINAPRRRRTTKRRTTRKRPSRKQLAARKKFAAMARARAKAARSQKRARTTSRQRKGSTMAKRRRGSARRRTRRNPMQSVRRRGKAISQKSWRAAGYRRNPRRRGYRRNPPTTNILGQVTELGMNSVAALGGMALGRTVSNAIPVGTPGDPITDFAKGVIIALGIKMVGPMAKLPKSVIDFAAVGAVLNPTKNLLTSFVPQAAPFLGDAPMFFPPVSAPMYRRLNSGVGAYSGDVVGSGVLGDDTGSQLGAYSGDGYM